MLICILWASGGQSQGEDWGWLHRGHLKVLDVATESECGTHLGPKRGKEPLLWGRRMQDGGRTTKELLSLLT